MRRADAKGLLYKKLLAAETHIVHAIEDLDQAGFKEWVMPGRLIAAAINELSEAVRAIINLLES